MFVPRYSITDSVIDNRTGCETKLHDKYPKLKDVMTSFIDTYGYKPDFIVYSPGRVNLIGEHIDYTDFSVLPLSLERDMLCAIKVDEDDENNPSLTLVNKDHIRFAGRKFALPLDASQINIDPSISDWSNYFKCGLYVAQLYLKEIYPEKFNIKPLKGMNVFCQGDVPVGSGLGSSSAIICAVTLGVISSNMGRDYQVPKADLLRITAVAEHYLGVNNGGMDQATSIYGEVGHALFVEFKPELKATPIEFPKMSENWEIEFIVADSLIESNKYDTASTNYNLRVVEVLIAANVLARYHGVVMNYDLNSNVRKGNLRDFMISYLGLYKNEVNFEINDSLESRIEQLKLMLKLTEECLGNNKDGHTVNEVSEALGCSREEFTREYLVLFPIRFQNLKIYKRAKHVFSEALRVMMALKLLDKKTIIGKEYLFYHEFGELMNASQKSCDELYECSTTEIDKICQIALNNGSYGSRLTGAGWGGSTVHLVPNGLNGCNVLRVKQALIDQYYRVKFPNITQETLDNAIIVSKAAPGSIIFDC